MVKPGSMNRGRGIEIFDSEKDIVSHLQQQRSGTQWVIQKYIERPLLVQGRKFDIRAFVLVTPDRKVRMPVFENDASTVGCLQHLHVCCFASCCTYLQRTSLWLGLL